MSELSQKVVVITGCSSGIGLDTAVLLAKDDNFKVIATMRNLQKKNDLEQAAGESLNKSLYIQELDISKEESILKFLKETYAAEGKIDILINNAAIIQEGPFECVTLDQIQALFQTNVFGTARLTQAVVKKMKEQRAGRIIFISSMAGILHTPFIDFYVASKFAIEGLVGCIAPVLRGFNIRVTSVQPGPVETAMIHKVVPTTRGEFPEDETEQNLDVDEETTSMRIAFQKAYALLFADNMQTGLDVAEVIKKCIYDDKPHVRVQTSPVMEEMARMALVDPTGDTETEQLCSLMQ